jgi:hypothetical protein
MAKSKHPGDSGDWNTEMPRPMTIGERTAGALSPVSPAVVEAMRQEEAFLNSITGTPPLKRFTGRRTIPGRDRLLP